MTCAQVQHLLSCMVQRSFGNSVTSCTPDLHHPAPTSRFPNYQGPLLTAAGGLLMARDGHAWMEAFTSVHPEYTAASFHFILSTTLAGHIGMFGVTLRDKKLVGQDAELLITGAPFLASGVFVGMLFIHFPWLVQAVGFHA